MTELPSTILRPSNNPSSTALLSRFGLGRVRKYTPFNSHPQRLASEVFFINGLILGHFHPLNATSSKKPITGGL